MAGSYNHAVAGGDGQLLCNEDLVQMVENMGDGYETIEQMYGMIWYLAAELNIARGGLSTAEYVELARRNHKYGLTLSPGIDGHLPEDNDE